MIHSSSVIDKKAKKKHHWSDFRGRWIAVLATNKIAGSNIIKDSIDLEKSN